MLQGQREYSTQLKELSESNNVLEAGQEYIKESVRSVEREVKDKGDILRKKYERVKVKLRKWKENEVEPIHRRITF
jgi:hypothetical protein